MTTLSFDHVHVISKQPKEAAEWYADRLGGKIAKSATVKDAPQIYVSFGDSYIIVRGQRPGESAQDKKNTEWGSDHFGFNVAGDFNAFCDGLKKKGVTFSVEPHDNNPTTRIAFIDAPDGVSIELLSRRAKP